MPLTIVGDTVTLPYTLGHSLIGTAETALMDRNRMYKLYEDGKVNPPTTPIENQRTDAAAPVPLLMAAPGKS